MDWHAQLLRAAWRPSRRRRDLLTGRAVFTEAYAVIPKGVMQRHRHQRSAVLGRDARLDACAAAVGLRRDVLAIHHGGRAGRRQRPAGAGRRRRRRAVRRRGRAERRRLPARAHALQPGGYAFLPPASGWTRPQRTAARRFASTGSARPTKRVDGIDVPEPIFANEQRDRADRHARHRRPLGNDALRRSGRHAPRHACHHRHLRARRRHPVRRDPCDGARPLCAGRQGGLPPQPGLGRGRGRRLYVAARLLPAGLLCRRARQIPLPALQGRQPAHEARRRGASDGRAHEPHRRTNR